MEAVQRITSTLPFQLIRNPHVRLGIALINFGSSHMLLKPPAAGETPGSDRRQLTRIVYHCTAILLIADHLRRLVDAWSGLKREMSSVKLHEACQIRAVAGGLGIMHGVFTIWMIEHSLRGGEVNTYVYYTDLALGLASTLLHGWAMDHTRAGLLEAKLRQGAKSGKAD